MGFELGTKGRNPLQRRFMASQHHWVPSYPAGPVGLRDFVSADAFERRYADLVERYGDPEVDNAAQLSLWL